MTPFANFLPEVMPYCQNVPEIIAINAVRNAAIEFCEKSHWLLHQNDAISAIGGMANYALSPPTATRVIRIQEVWFEDRPLAAKAQEELRDMYLLDWRERTGAPAFYTQMDDCEIRLVPLPEEASVDAIKAIAAIAPTRTSVGVEDCLFERWMEIIAIGARARLYETPGQPYTDPAAWQNAAARFRAGINAAKADRNRGGTRAQLHVRMPRFV